MATESVKENKVFFLDWDQFWPREAAVEQLRHNKRLSSSKNNATCNRSSSLVRSDVTQQGGGVCRGQLSGRTRNRQTLLNGIIHNVSERHPDGLKMVLILDPDQSRT